MTKHPLFLAALIGLAGVSPAHAAAQDGFFSMFWSKPSQHVTIVLVDISGSINPADRALYRESLRAVADEFRSGDRLIVANVGNDTRGSFRTTLDISVPASNVRLRREAAEKRARTSILSSIPRLVPERAAPARFTRILETIAAGAQAFEGRQKEGARLIILSDAVEESAKLNLARAAISPQGINQALAAARKDGLVPDLRGVEIHIVGAGGTHYSANRAFWAAYARATGSRLRAYGRLPYRPGS